MFSDLSKLFFEFDKSLIDFDNYFQYNEKSQEDLIFLVSAITARYIWGGKDVDYGKMLGWYKRVPIICEQPNFQGLWVRHIDNIYYKFAEFDWEE